MRDELTLVRRVFNTSAGTLPKARRWERTESTITGVKGSSSTSTDDSVVVHPVSR
jgi:hypothetical protein